MWDELVNKFCVTPALNDCSFSKVRLKIKMIDNWKVFHELKQSHHPGDLSLFLSFNESVVIKTKYT